MQDLGKDVKGHLKFSQLNVTQSLIYVGFLVNQQDISCGLHEILVVLEPFINQTKRLSYSFKLLGCFAIHTSAI